MSKEKLEQPDMKVEMKKLFFAVFITGCFLGLWVMISGCSEGEGPVRSTPLRSKYKTLGEADVKSMLKARDFFDKRRNKGHGFPNIFELKEVNHQSVVIDHAAGLVWHQSGSTVPVPFAEAKRWIKDLNQTGYAGYSNWRLPTLEEATSLLEKKQTKYRYIDPLFLAEQYSIHTGDIYNETRLWGVSYQYGSIFRVGIQEPNYVRPVTKYQGQ